MNFLLVIIFLIFAFVFYFIQKANHEKKIYEKIDSIGGTVIEFERKTFSTGPFWVVGKGRTIYRIEYIVGDTVCEGWVRFGGLFGPDWRL